MRRLLAIACLLLLIPGAPAPRAQQRSPASPSASASSGLALLAPTIHPQVPEDLSQFWLAPDRSTLATRSVATSAVEDAARFAGDEDFGKALALASQPVVQRGPLALYGLYYTGLSQLRLDRAAEALATFQQLETQKPVGYLWEGAALGEAEAQEALDNPAEAVRIYERLLNGRLTDVERVYMRLGRAAKAAGDLTRAAAAFAHIYYEFPLGENVGAAEDELETLGGFQPLESGTARYQAELGRAERLFHAKRYADARTAFSALRNSASGDDATFVNLRVAECDYYTRRVRGAADALKTLTSAPGREAEALYFFGLAASGLRQTPTFVQTLERVAAEYPDTRWAEEALNTLATHFIRADDDDRATGIFKAIVERFPNSSYSERASWKFGWASYRAGDFATTATVFERAAASFARSDYRPAWLYWSGRAHERLGHADLAQQRYTLTATDYGNSYYGRMATRRLDPRARAAVAQAPLPSRAATTLPPNGATIRLLLGASMLDDALNELEYAERVWGDSAAIQATKAWIYQQKAHTERGMRRLQLLRAGINAMRRAYPQFMTADGDSLPREVLTVIFPMQYWDLIQRHAEANGLDPYFVAALVAQESTFVADVRSAANAYGLMQLLPATARQYARKMNVRYSSRLLTDPEWNIRIGTRYLADKLREFGDTHLALASYNAGERAVRRWQSERPGLDAEEFVDDIPYPETQGYVKKILGSADDYRQLYSSASKQGSVDTIGRPASTDAARQPATTPPPAPKAGSAPKKTPAPRKAPARKTVPAKRSTH